MAAPLPLCPLTASAQRSLVKFKPDNSVCMYTSIILWYCESVSSQNAKGSKTKKKKSRE